MPGMLRLLSLMLICLLALPAVQARACAPDAGHGAAQMAAMVHGEGHHGNHHAPAPPSEPARHDCLGCIAPIDLDSYRPVQRLNFTLDRADRATSTTFPASLGSPPEPPPPRFLV